MIIAAIMRCRIPARQGKRTVTFVVWKPSDIPPASAFDKTAYRNASTRETYAPSLARGHWSLGRSGVVLCAVRRHRGGAAHDDDTLTPILMDGFRHN
ncbi:MULTISPECIES: hypothetical protein [Bradyrhizobium]|uniref:hypothetical protein n=1 Tax=Bradyrhizobium TaxID=374 RepID=UPI0012BC82CB|nr:MULTISPECIES: hypothetical protein [Bradyrhizobium]MCS3444884.1 hypothetical protein [Bradyrhizobium elkanii]MCS3563988.1 hypothetical protein [Bradyrhizobium elkanii]MCW2146180.1 hypothetical protein [Bradyrhizobium elkanii]MCW2354747.1 hypothetical protein [Bradyrhizobium elkanii]MCW2379007.1 hypothetical protein [Bradyrhizobium elkanii]